jgi:hypothetical protein
MRALFLPLVLALGLSACADPVADAQRELEIVRQSHGTPADICKASRKVAEAYLKAQNQPRYEEANVTADITCSTADSAAGH